MNDDSLRDAMLSLRKPRALAPVPSPPPASALAGDAPPPGDAPQGAAPALAPPPPTGAPKAKPTGKPRAKPKATGKVANKPKATGKGKVLVPEIIEDGKCGIEDESGIKEVNLKDQLTEKEQLFIEIFLAGGTSRDEGMISAGYGNYSQSHRMGLSRKIIAKYESLAGEHRKTFRAVGAGEVAVAQGLLDLATNSKSEMVRLNAWTAIGKILGLTQDVVAVNQGIQIVIKGRGEGPAAVQVQREPAKMLPRVMAITK